MREFHDPEQPEERLEGDAGGRELAPLELEPKRSEQGFSETELPPGSEAPREGTLAWLQLQPHETVLGLELPACHRVPEGSSLAEGNGHCRVVKPTGERCRAPATRSYGVCLVHAGGGGILDASAMARKANATKARLRARRQLLGIGPARAANPRQIARVAAMERAADVASALLAPLDDKALGSLQRQAGARALLAETMPLQHATIEVELPASGDDVPAMGWAQMQALAARLLEPET